MSEICKLCQQPIAEFDPMQHQLQLDAETTVELCADCIKKFLKWQQQLFAVIHPTKQAKKFTHRA